MPDLLLCPDCGGIVGATTRTPEGGPCTCFAPANHPVSSDDTAVTQSPAPAEPAVEKLCAVCGKDVAGHRRVKDSRGYICYDCAKNERKEERGDRIKCRVCGREVKESVVVNYEGIKICPQCHREKLDLQKKQIKKLGIEQAHIREEKRGLYIMLGMAGVLGLIMLLSHFHLLPGLHH